MVNGAKAALHPGTPLLGPEVLKIVTPDPIITAWLLKVNAAGIPQPEASKRNAFSFFEPLDERFLGLMAEFCRKEGIELLAGFWTSNFFAYLDYQPGDENLPYAELQARLRRMERPAMQTNRLSPLGEFWSKLAHSSR